MPSGRTPSDYEPQTIRHIMGIVGADPEKNDSSYPSDDGSVGTYVTFPVYVTRGYGDDENRPYSVSVNKPRLQDAVMADIRKGSRVGIEGLPSTREYQGRTYHNFKAFRIGLIDYIGMGEPTKRAQGWHPSRDDDDL